MKKALLLFSIGLLISDSALAGTKCFLVKENDKVIQQEGECKTRHAPCSTFKIAISLMGYNERFMLDENHPEIAFKAEYDDYFENWKQPYTPKLWMQNSCIWYSKLITKEMGIKKFQSYVTKFNYGNQDLSGDKGKNNGITNAWLSSSLEISPEEQIVFLQKLLNNQLPVTVKAHEMTRNIIVSEELVDGWKVYGKTGSGSKLNHDRTQKLDQQIGWFIGWIEKDNRKITFAHYIEDKNKDEGKNGYAGPRAKVAAKEKLVTLVKNMGK